MKKILLVDDDPFFQKFYTTKLVDHGYEVEVASDGEEALAKFKQSEFTLVLLDLVMPKKDGFAVLQGISESVSKKKTPVIIFSTLGQDQDIEKAKQLGAADYVHKTFFNFEELVGKIEKLSS